jgi:hypothetical protein
MLAVGVQSVAQIIIYPDIEIVMLLGWALRSSSSLVAFAIHRPRLVLARKCKIKPDAAGMDHDVYADGFLGSISKIAYISALL